MRLSALHVAMLILTLLPGSFSKIFINADSLKEGLLMASILAAMLLMIKGQTIKVRQARRLSGYFGLAIMVITLHGMLTMFGGGFNISRFVLSLVFLTALFILWLPITEALLNAKPENLDNTFRWCYWILLIDGLVSTVLYQLGRSKEMFFAAEPSHFALTFLPFLFYKMFRDRSPWHLALAFTIAIFIGNLTMLAGLALLTAFYYRHRQILLVAVFMLGIISVGMMPDFSRYLVERLTFSSDSDNLSALVFMSGFERSYETLANGHWLGVGFQQMGFVGPSGELIDTISQITGGNELNLYDGGTLASKLIVEFGGLGVATIILYLVSLARLFLRGSLERLAPHALFFSGVHVTFACYLFVRGMGYMSLTVVLFLVAQINLVMGETLRRRKVDGPINASTLVS